MKLEHLAVTILSQKIQIVRGLLIKTKLFILNLDNVKDWSEAIWSTMTYVGSSPILQADNDWDAPLQTYDLKTIIENSYEITWKVRGGRKFILFHYL